MHDTCGPRSATAFAFYDPATSSVKMSQGTLLSDSTGSSVTLPASGIACGGRLYELPTSVPPTVASDCSSLLPTPAVNDMGEGKTPEAWDAWTAKMQDKHGNGNGHGKSLAIEAARLLPTPTARDHKGSVDPASRDRKMGSLDEAVERLLPTPRSQGNSKVWYRPDGQPQNLENALARLPGATTPPTEATEIPLFSDEIWDT